MLNKVKNAKGFTLIELMIVVAIIGVLAAIAIPNFLSYQSKSRQSEAKINLGSIFTSQTAFLTENSTGLYAGTFNQLGWTPAGTPRYVYRVGAGTTDCGIAGVALAAGCNQINYTGVAAATPQAACSTVSSTSAALPATFVATAVANLDTDPIIDCWQMGQTRALNDNPNDVS